MYLCCHHIHGRYDPGAHMMSSSMLLLTSTHKYTFVSRFACFHYQHRKQTSESADRRAHRCCIVKLRTALDVHKFAKCYHGRRWIKLSKSGSRGEGRSNEIELSMKCSISAFQGTAEQEAFVPDADQGGGPDALAPAYRRCVPVYIPASVFWDLAVKRVLLLQQVIDWRTEGDTRKQFLSHSVSVYREFVFEEAPSRLSKQGGLPVQMELACLGFLLFKSTAQRTDGK